MNMAQQLLAGLGVSPATMLLAGWRHKAATPTKRGPGRRAVHGKAVQRLQPDPLHTDNDRDVSAMLERRALEREWREQGIEVCEYLPRQRNVTITVDTAGVARLPEAT